MNTKKIFKTVFSLSGIILVGKVLGFLKQLITASAFGATMETDIINLSINFVANTEYIIAQTMITAFVAVYIDVSVRDGGRGKVLLADTLKLLTIALVVLIGGLELLAGPIARLIAPSYTGENLARLTHYLQLCLPMVILFTWTAIFHAVLNAKEMFVPGQMLSINQSIIVIAVVVLLGPVLGAKAICVGFILYVLWNTLFLGYFTRRDLSLRRENPLKNPDELRLLKMMLPLLVGYGMIFINQQVDKIIVSGMAEGTVTAMSYSSVLSQLVCTLITSVCTVLFTHIAKKQAENDMGTAATLTSNSAVILVSVFLPVSILTVIFSSDIVSIVYERGAFASHAVSSAGEALMGYGFCFVPYALKNLYNKFEYGLQNTKAPMTNATIGIGFNIAMSLLLYRPLGVLGVTLASSMAELLTAVLNIVYSVRRTRELKMEGLAGRVLLWLAAGAVCVGVGLAGRTLLADTIPLVRFIVSTLVAMAAYGAIVGPVVYRLMKKNA